MISLVCLEGMNILQPYMYIYIYIQREVRGSAVCAVMAAVTIKLQKSLTIVQRQDVSCVLSHCRLQILVFPHAPHSSCICQSRANIASQDAFLPCRPLASTLSWNGFQEEINHSHASAQHTHLACTQEALLSGIEVGTAVGFERQLVSPIIPGSILSDSMAIDIDAIECTVKVLRRRPSW